MPKIVTENGYWKGACGVDTQNRYRRGERVEAVNTRRSEEVYKIPTCEQRRSFRVFNRTKELIMYRPGRRQARPGLCAAPRRGTTDFPRKNRPREKPVKILNFAWRKMSLFFSGAKPSVYLQRATA
ncbi:hypothetical protein Bbelb_177390 [Branchiostoma belcheri]|nr:hypothetical protein Bbelb_177390 [Branchiostoma belcheri]